MAEVDAPEHPQAHRRSLVVATKSGATVFQTSLNVGKMCMGTGVLALPYAADRAGLLWNAVGLGLIGLWNYYCAECLLRCGRHVRTSSVGVRGLEEAVLREELRPRGYGSAGARVEVDGEKPAAPPEGTTAYGAVAWHAAGSRGLVVLDALMILLFFGILMAYEGSRNPFLFCHACVDLVRHVLMVY